MKILSSYFLPYRVDRLLFTLFILFKILEGLFMIAMQRELMRMFWNLWLHCLSVPITIKKQSRWIWNRLFEELSLYFPKRSLIHYQWSRLCRLCWQGAFFRLLIKARKDIYLSREWFWRDLEIRLNALFSFSNNLNTEDKICCKNDSQDQQLHLQVGISKNLKRE